MFATPTHSSAFKNLYKFKGFSTTAMPLPQALFKLLNPEAPWDRIPLRDVKYVTDLQKVIKNEASRKLAAYDASDLILKATQKIDDADQAKELDPRKDLAAVLKDFQVEISAKESVPQLFADNIRLFVNTPITGLPSVLKRKLEGQITSSKRRKFAVGVEAYPDLNFYIEPNILEKFGEYLLQRQFCLLIGHRQSGKTTICQALRRWFNDHPEMFTEFAGGNRDDFDVHVITFTGSVTAEDGPEAFWKSVCKRFRAVDPERFAFNDTEIDSETFTKFFSKRANPSSKPVILIIDEASRLISMDGTISEATKKVTDEFISTLRSLKNPYHYLLHSIALVGTGSIRELLIAHNKPGASSQISPFTEETTWTADRFTKAEVKELFDQFTKDEDEFESADISADIFELTLGHKGLVGSCGAFIQQTYDLQPSPIRTADEWKKATTHELREYILDEQHYESIVRSLNLLTPESKSMLIGVLRYGTREVKLTRDATKYLLAEGMVSVKERKKDRSAIIECSAPILRSLMLTNITRPGIRLSRNAPDEKKVDPQWLLAQTIENLCFRHLYSPQTLNANESPSEYTFQSEFATIFRNLVPLAYPLLQYKILVEVKEKDEFGERRQRLDILICDGTSLPSYGFELVVSANEKIFHEHCERAEKYGKLHKCQMFMVNLCPKVRLHEYFGGRPYALTPVNVVIDPQEKKGIIKYADRDESVSISGSDWDMLFTV